MTLAATQTTLRAPPSFSLSTFPNSTSLNSGLSSVASSTNPRSPRLWDPTTSRAVWKRRSMLSTSCPSEPTSQRGFGALGARPRDRSPSLSGWWLWATRRPSPSSSPCPTATTRTPSLRSTCAASTPSSRRSVSEAPLSSSPQATAALAALTRTSSRHRSPRRRRTSPLSAAPCSSRPSTRTRARSPTTSAGEGSLVSSLSPRTRPTLWSHSSSRASACPRPRCSTPPVAPTPMSPRCRLASPSLWTLCPCRVSLARRPPPPRSAVSLACSMTSASPPTSPPSASSTPSSTRTLPCSTT
mmetsp:Transcript_13206/g.31207  ORF Transcript_13206/g.31207 Transcript_13206/m.31207 type:complete len:299 (-) Transcript_13206:189-1085(-)